jgi:hypothetical protein
MPVTVDAERALSGVVPLDDNDRIRSLANTDAARDAVQWRKRAFTAECRIAQAIARRKLREPIAATVVGLSQRRSFIFAAGMADVGQVCECGTSGRLI